MKDSRRQTARGKDRRTKRKLSSKSESRHSVYLRNLGLVLVSGVVVVEEEDKVVVEEEAAVAAAS